MKYLENLKLNKIQIVHLILRKVNQIRQINKDPKSSSKAKSPSEAKSQVKLNHN